MAAIPSRGLSVGHKLLTQNRSGDIDSAAESGWVGKGTMAPRTCPWYWHGSCTGRQCHLVDVISTMNQDAP